MTENTSATEPVAWMYEYGLSRIVKENRDPGLAKYYTETPLYALPPAPAVSGVAKMREDVASLVTAATAVRNACLGTPVGGRDGGTYVPGHPTTTELNNLTAAINAYAARAALGEKP